MMEGEMTIGELKAIIDALHDLHGPETNAVFVYQRASGRTGRGDITSFRVSLGLPTKWVQFDVDYPRGEAE
jgi:hypothetical protein